MRFELATSLVLAACAADDETGVVPPAKVTDEIAVTTATLDSAISVDPDDDICALLPDCGPCSLACDLDALAEQYVPEGTCALFACTLVDGRTIRVDACNVTP